MDKGPNLGGLARTAEIFGAEALVVPDAAVARTKDFQRVAVTADQWIPVVEVRPRNLRAWLVEKKARGYAIVALEQATNSTSLVDAALPTPAVLLLGREKEGVPNDLMDLVDVCVEIPQLGVVRSLNVHVSGALCIWHFARQHLLARN